MEIHFAADSGHSHAVAIAADARNDAADKMPRLGVAGLAEAKRVHHRDRSCTHGEDVTHNAADAGGGALIGLDEARVVVTLHLENAGIAVVDVDDAGVLAWPLQHPRRLGRKLAQMDARRLVGAMLAPHHAEDAELDET